MAVLWEDAPAAGAGKAVWREDAHVPGLAHVLDSMLPPRGSYTLSCRQKMDTVINLT